MLTFTVSRRRAWIVALVVLVGVIWLVRDDQARAGGIPPGEGIDVVYVAVSTNFPDALGVGPGAAANSAPIILVPTNPPLPGYTSAELHRLDPQKVIIVGGTAVVSQAMEDAIAALLPNATVERLAGSDRYETNTLFTQSVYPVEGWASVDNTAFLPLSTATVTRVQTYSHTGDTGDMFAPIQLPHGATLLDMRVIGHDSDGGEETHVLLEEACSGTSAYPFDLMSSGSGGTFDLSDSADGISVVDNENCAYAVRATGTDGDNRVELVLIHYRLGTPGA